MATRVGGLPEAVEDGRTGLVVAPGSAPALAEALVRVLGDAGLGERLRAGVVAERHRFDWSALVGLLEEMAGDAPDELLGDVPGAD
jgi:glycosyltransferase involved in cell wall biosynthesis